LSFAFAIMGSIAGPRRQPTRSTLVALKEHNEWRVVQALREVGGVSRAELVSLTGLSRSTVANVIGELQDRGIVDERLPSRDSRARRGRPGTSVALRTDAGVAVGIGIDRDRIRLAAFDLGAEILMERTEPIAQGASGVDVVEFAAQLVRQVVTQVGARIGRIIGVGIGLPGPVDISRGGVDRQSSSRRWAGLNVRDELSRRLGGVHVFPDNDANFGALGEHRYGVGRGVDNLIYVRVGPGIGGGLVIGGTLFRGEIGYAGDIGHLPAIEHGNLCTCGRTGCLSSVSASWAIVSRLTPSHGPELTIGRVLTLAEEGDAQAREALHESGTHVGRVLGGLVSALNPGLLVLGGDVGAHSPDFLEGAAEALTAQMLPTTAAAIRVAHAAPGDRSELLGAGARVLSDDSRMRAFVASV
jgi:predicted NBD/HSP70 family sugar kinase